MLRMDYGPLRIKEGFHPMTSIEKRFIIYVERSIRGRRDSFPLVKFLLNILDDNSVVSY